jgi:hypothetical protein
MIYIRNIPRDILLYELWKYAKPSPYFKHCTYAIPLLTVELARDALNDMIANNNLLSVCTFYGKTIYADITDDYLDQTDYDIYNGKGLAKTIINNIKKKLLNRCLIKYLI